MNSPTFVQEYKDILEVLNKYNEGGTKADSSIMKPAFNEQATIFSVDTNGKLVGGPIQGLFDIIDNDFKPSPNAKNAVVCAVQLTRAAREGRRQVDNRQQDLSHARLEQIHLFKVNLL